MLVVVVAMFDTNERLSKTWDNPNEAESSETTRNNLNHTESTQNTHFWLFSLNSG